MLSTYHDCLLVVVYSHTGVICCTYIYVSPNLSRMSPSWTKAYATLRTKDPALFASPKRILVLPGLVCVCGGGGGGGVSVTECVFWTVTAVAKNTFSDHYMSLLVQSVVCRDHNAQWLK